MKTKLLKSIIILFLTYSSIANAQELQRKYVETYCVSKDVLETTLSEFKEVPLFRSLSHRGESVATSLVIFVSQETKTWSIVEKIQDNLYCIIGLGQEFEVVPQEIRDTLEVERQRKKL